MLTFALEYCARVDREVRAPWCFLFGVGVIHQPLLAASLSCSSGWQHVIALLHSSTHSARSYIPTVAFGPGCVCLQVNPIPVDGFAYEQLRDTIKGFEVAEFKTKKGNRALHGFSTEMQLVDMGGGGVKWAWVRCKNIEAFVGDMGEMDDQRKLN